MGFETGDQQPTIKEHTRIVIEADHCEGAACTTDAPRSGATEFTKAHKITPKGTSRPHLDGGKDTKCFLPNVELELNFHPEAKNAPGIRGTNVDLFPKQGNDVFNPVRPPGLAELQPGQATDDEIANAKVDRRLVQAASDANHDSIFRYQGKLNDWSVFHLKSDTEFTAEEVVDSHQKLVASHVKYLSPVDIKVEAPLGSTDTLNGVTMSDTKRDCDGNYKTTFSTSDGRTVTYQTNDKGAVIKSSQ